MIWLIYGTVLVIILVCGVVAFRREAAYRRRTGITRPERHDPGEKYLPPPPPAAG